ncbi:MULTISPECIES: hypothetical protein [unclassified Streptomyces]|uniref:hypothetical protein n=1 Tax=unclassified Streptomyces TaxID=2593676 RepID=UPI002ED1AEBF|nr:hypothetical protein OH827_02515 [Streptomyces sp. NBC_00891]WSY03966.1 hypothetical protein OG464_02515 [Streptomyces sp. NBC_00890]WSZ05592.1 hypothetical protein OG704_02515 [Streptomyces sp. NBC_00869]WSZ26912.1 hypothetical protein OG498_31050 [Streptomyces sp. NBC_00870]
MNTADGPDLLFPQCCAHLTSFRGDSPYASVTGFAAPASLPAGPRSRKPEPTAESGALQPSANRVLDA